MPRCSQCGVDTLSGRADTGVVTTFYCISCWARWEGLPPVRPAQSEPGPALRALGAEDGLPGLVVFCVNLDRRPDRWRRTLALLVRTGGACLLHCLYRVPAVDGACIELRRLPRWFLEARTSPMQGTGMAIHLDCLQLPPGAVGCALSHFRIWEAMDNARRTGSGPSWALVLEDDVVLAADDLKVRMQEVLQQLPDDWDLCYLGFHTHRDIQLESLRLLESGVRDDVGSWHLHRTDREVCGTFAYLVSAKGASRLLEPGVIFPLSEQRQLDAAMSHAFEKLSVWTAPLGSPLFFSPQSQAMTSESDVQSRYYGPVEPQWVCYRQTMHKYMQELDALAAATPNCGWDPALTLAPCDEIETALSQSSRRCILVDFVDPGEPLRAHLVEQLRLTLVSIRDVDILPPILLVWYGADSEAAQATIAKLPPCQLMPRGPFAEEVERLLPGAGPQLERLALRPFISLQSFNVVELDQLLYLSPGEELGGLVSAVFDGNVSAELHVRPSSESSAGAQELLRTLGVTAVPSFSTRVLLFNRRSWVKVSHWAQEMIRLWHRDDLPFSCEASDEARGELVARCALSLAEIDVGVLREESSGSRVGTHALSRGNCSVSQTEWEAVD